MMKVIKIVVIIVLGIALLQWLGSNSLAGKSKHGAGGSTPAAGANSNISIGGPQNSTAGGATGGPVVIHTARPSAFPALPPYAPNEEPRPGLIAFAFESPAYGNDNGIQSIGDGSTLTLGSFRWKPARAGEMRLFDGGNGMGLGTGHALAYVMRGALPIPYGGPLTLGLRLTHAGFKAGAKCSLHILVGGYSYASDLFSWPEKSPAGSVETTATFDGIAPGAALDIGYAFACATADGSQEALRDVTIDPLMKTPARPAWRLLREADFVFPRSAL